MKSTFDLPPELIREVKLRAVHEGRPLKDVATSRTKAAGIQASAGETRGFFSRKKAKKGRKDANSFFASLAPFCD